MQSQYRALHYSASRGKNENVDSKLWEDTAGNDDDAVLRDIEQLEVRWNDFFVDTDSEMSRDWQQHPDRLWTVVACRDVLAA